MNAILYLINEINKNIFNKKYTKIKVFIKQQKKAKKILLG
jgi:hypothetical protein